MSLNTFLILVWWWDHFWRPYGYCENIFHTQKCPKMALFRPQRLSYKGKWPKNVIFHDFFKLLLNVPRCYPRYVEMFLGPLEGVLSLRIHFWLVSKPHVKWTFSAQILSLAQYWASDRIWAENVHFTWGLETSQKCILRLKTPSRGPKNISTYLG